jgi:hypothetical protein
MNQGFIAHKGSVKKLGFVEGPLIRTAGLESVRFT